MGNKGCCCASSQTNVDLGPRSRRNPEKARKKDKKKQRDLDKKVKKGKGPTAASLKGQMQYISDEEDAGGKHKVKEITSRDVSERSEPE